MMFQRRAATVIALQLQMFDAELIFFKCGLFIPDSTPLKPVIKEKPVLPPTKPMKGLGNQIGVGSPPAILSPTGNALTEAKSQTNSHSSPEISFLPKPDKENKVLFDHFQKQSADNTCNEAFSEKSLCYPLKTTSLHANIF